MVKENMPVDPSYKTRKFQVSLGYLGNVPCSKVKLHSKLTVALTA